MITEERISTFISSFDTGNTSFLNELEEFAIKTNVPVIRPQMQNLLKLLLAMLGEISYEKVSPLFTDTQTNIIQMNQMLRTNGTQGKSKGHPGGPCIPGKKRIFVDVEGNIYPCERIAEYPNYQIGNIFDGFDIERIKQMIKMDSRICLYVNPPDKLRCYLSPTHSPEWTRALSYAAQISTLSNIATK